MGLAKKAIIVMAISALACVAPAAASELHGSWRLISFQNILENENPQNILGDNPKGHLVMTPEGRMLALLTSGERKSGTSDAERAALHRSMIAYSGPYRIEGATFTVKIDASWIEAWNGTEQKRLFKVEGNRLWIETEPQPSPRFAGKMATQRIIWERE